MKIMIVFLLGVLFGLAPLAQAQFREEIATLENMYESRARTVLNTVLRPYEYSLIVAVDIDRDESRLKKIQDDYDKNYLPGMPGMAAMDNPAVTNQLYEIKTKVEVHLVLSNLVPKDKEETLKSVLKMKLHLDDKNGDTVTIARANLPVEKEESQPSKLPELSWKMWVLMLIMALLALSGLFLYLSRKPKKDETKDKPESDIKPEVPLTEEPELVASNGNDKTPGLDPSELLYEQKQQILSLATQYPEATIHSLTEHFQKGHEKDILFLCEAFGWELSKKIFSDFSPRIWGKLGSLLIQRTEAPVTEDYSKALETCHKVVLKKFLELGDQDSKNPFGFLWKLTLSDRQRLLANESAANLALICLYADREQMGDLFESINSDLQEAVTINIARLEKVPAESIQSASQVLLNKLKLIKENPEIKTNGPELAAGLLRSLPAEKEAPFFAKMKAENPNEAERIRRVILLFEDLVFVPSDAIAEMASLLDVSVIVTALRQGFPEVRDYVLKALPPKKSMMVQRDLEIEVLNLSPRQVAQCQREIVQTVTSFLKAKSIELDQLIPKKDSGEKKQPRGVEAA